MESVTLPENCDGTSKECVADGFVEVGTDADAKDGICDVEEKVYRIIRSMSGRRRSFSHD